jgi:hypothetical protein
MQADLAPAPMCEFYSFRQDVQSEVDDIRGAFFFLGGLMLLLGGIGEWILGK